MATRREGFDFERLDVYQRSVQFVSAIYRLTKGFPDYEQFGLSAQLRRAAVAVPANLAEGSGRYSSGERRQFYRIARASIFECVALLEVAKNERYLNADDWRETYDQCLKMSQMVSGLIRSLK